MKHENGYWIDENNNRWGECCGKERAKELSLSWKRMRWKV